MLTVTVQLPQNKAAGPGLLTTWSFKCSKMSIGTDLQFAINECISKDNFPDVLKKAYVIPIYKKGDPLEAEKTADQFQLHRLLQKLLKKFFAPTNARTC